MKSRASQEERGVSGFALWSGWLLKVSRSVGAFWAHRIEVRAHGRPRTHWRNNIYYLPRDRQEEVESVAGDKLVCNSMFSLLPICPSHGWMGGWWMGGGMGGCLSLTFVSDMARAFCYCGCCVIVYCGTFHPVSRPG